MFNKTDGHTILATILPLTPEAGRSSDFGVHLPHVWGVQHVGALLGHLGASVADLGLTSLSVPFLLLGVAVGV